MSARFNYFASAWMATLAAMVVSHWLAGQALADVTSIGSVNPVPPAAGGTFSGALVVGDDQAANADTRAWLQIDDGTALQYGTLIVGDEEGFVGVVNVHGDFLAGLNTSFILSSAASSSNPAVQVGLDGTGYLNVRGGATMSLSSSQSDMSIGQDPTGVGYVTISDPFTMLTVGEDFFIGREGIGRLDVLNGALVQTTSTSTLRAVTIGSDATGIGTVNVDGLGSVLRAGSRLVIGGLGAGTLTIGNQAIVDVDNVTGATTTVGLLGRVKLAGGTLIGQTPTIGFGTTVNGVFGGSGLVRGSVSLSADSALEVGPGELLRFSGVVSNQGAATIDRGEVQFLAGFTNNAIGALPAPGRISLEDGTLRFSQTPTSNAGVLSSAQGTNNVHGELTNSGTIVVASETVATFHDTVTNSGTINVLPRGNALFLTNLIFTAPGAVLLDVGQNGTINTSARIEVAGAVTLGGNLTVSTHGGFTPVLGQTFDLITATGGISGTFSSISIPPVPGPLGYEIFYNPTSVQMVVIVGGSTTPLPGDYNADGAVDAADYVVWRNNQGTTNMLPNDPIGGTVGQAHYDQWRAHFGESASGGAGATGSASAQAAVPEPASWVLLTWVAMGWFFQRRRAASPVPRRLIA